MNKIMRAWDRKHGVAYVYRDSETGRTKIGEEKFDWFFYVKNKDFQKYSEVFSLLKEKDYVTKYESEHTYTKVFVEREHNSDLLDKNMQFVWEYKDKVLNYVLKYLSVSNIQHFEADLKIFQRWIIENNIQFESEYKLLYLDIETDDRMITGQPVPGEFQILSCSLIDGQNQKKAWLCCEDFGEEHEKKFLENLAKVINGYDVLIGFNSSSFDFPYIKARMAMYGIQIDWRKKFLQDLMKIYQKLGPQLPSYSLDSIAKFAIKRGKVITNKKTWELFKYDKQLLKKYNMEDSQLMVDIERKTGFLGVSREVNTMGKCPCDDPYISRKIDNMVLRQAYIDGHYHFKTKDYNQEIKKHSFEGAFVLEPKVGLYKNVKVLDIGSLYPNTIRTFNISPDTLITSENEMDVPKDQIINSPSGHKFRKDFVGIIPKVIFETAEKRNYYKKLIKTVQPNSVEHKTYDRLQYVFKYFGLSFYGAMGLQTSRFYDSRVAESVTLGGQLFIKKSIEHLNKTGNLVIYSDSVTGDRCTWIVENGCLKLKTFQELFEMADIIIERDEKERRRFSKPIFTVSYNFKENKSEFKKIEQIIKHKTNKNIYLYRSRDGVTNCTEDHSLINKIGICFKPFQLNNEAKNIKLPKFSKWYGIIDLRKFIGNYKYDLKFGKIRELKFKDNKIFLNDAAFFDRYLDLNDVSRVKKLLKLLAHYICNGASSTIETTKSRFGAMIGIENKELIYELKDIYSEFFHGFNVNVLVPNFKQREDLKQKGWNVFNKGYKLQIMNALSAIIFKQLCGQKAYEKKIPDFIYMLDEELQRYFLLELIEGNGNYQDGNMRFETSSLKLISGMALIFDTLRIKHSIDYKEIKKTYMIHQYTNEQYSKHLIKNKNINLGKIKREVYDISVEANNNFVDACGNILLHNTDSAFIQLEHEEEIPKLIKEIHDICQDISIKQCNANECTVEFAYDKGFSKFIIIAKKRYAGYLTYLDERKLIEPKLYVAGLEFKRTDQCLLLKKKQEELLKLLLSEKGINLSEARKFLENVKKYVFGNEIKLEEICFGQKLTKEVEEYKAETMHLKVVEEMIKDNKEVYVGDKICYFIEDVDKNGKPIPRPLYKFNGKFAKVYMFNNKILPPLTRLLEVVFKEIDWSSYEFRTVGKNKNPKYGRMGLWNLLFLLEVLK